MMSNFFIYLIQASIVFSVLYVLYRMVFSRFTFHVWNRIVLLLFVPFSLLLPLSANWFPHLPELSLELPFVEDFSAFANMDDFSQEMDTVVSTETNFVFWLFVLYSLCVGCFLVRFCITQYRLFVLYKQSQKIYARDTTLLIAKTPAIFSYFRWIFIPAKKIDSIDNLTITHEKAHIQQWHSVDIVIAELFIAFFWFHPLAYSYRNSLKNVHEYLADAFVLHQQIKKSTYLEVLLQSLSPKNINPVYNYFSHPTLKKRIEMMTKSPSKNSSKLTYLLLFPVLMFAFLAFTKAEKLPLSVETQLETTVSDGIPSIFPVQNGTFSHISSRFGIVRKHPKLANTQKHSGIDIKAKAGTPIVATADGVVIKANNEGNWGNLIVISHAEGFETWYAHLQGFHTNVRSSVKKGEIIGFVGNTGLSTAPHLHYEVRQDGKKLNPEDFITK